MKASLVCLTATCSVLTACDLRDAMTTEIEVVATAAAQELPVDELADMMARSSVPLNRAAVERWALIWVDYSLFAQRLAEGDSLLDSVAVRAARWYDIDSIIIGRMRGALAESQIRVDDAVVDSVFTAGRHRLLDLIVIQVTPDMTPVERERRRRAAAALRARVAGGGSWDRVVAELDPNAGARSGRTFVTREVLPSVLADSAFTLEPGGLTDVIEAREAFYIVRRPLLAESRADLALALRDTLVSRMQVAYFDSLPVKWDIRVTRRAPALVRQAVRYPYQRAASTEVLGTFRGGKFTVTDFVRWIPLLPVQGQLAAASDDQLRELVQSLIQSEMLVLEARERGYGLQDEEYNQLKQRLAEQVEQVRAALDLDVLLGTSTTPEMLRRMVQLNVARHLADVLGGERRLAMVPPFLAETLRQTSRWELSYAAVDRTVEQAKVSRQQMAQAATAIRPPLSVPPSPPSEGRRDAR